MRRPGRSLRAVAARICAKHTMERLIDPIVADVQMEYEQAIEAGRRWQAAWVCVDGYFAFWKAVGVHMLQSAPRALANTIVADGAARRTIAYSFIVFVTVTLLLTAWPMINEYSRFSHVRYAVLLLPQAVPIGIPIALSLGVIYAYGAGLSRPQVRGVLLLSIIAAVLGFAAMLTIPHANQAWRVAVAQELGLRGITQYSLPKGANELSFAELATAISEYEAGGLPERARQYKLTYHIRLALPSATLVLTLLALGIGGVLHGRALRVVALVLGLTAYYVMLIAFGARMDMLPPVVAVWTPNTVFTVVSLTLLMLSSAQRHSTHDRAQAG